MTHNPNPNPKGLLEDGVDEDGLAARGIAEQVRVRGRGTARRRRAVEELLEDAELVPVQQRAIAVRATPRVRRARGPT